jgi:putative addiction module CopG family antidote
MTKVTITLKDEDQHFIETAMKTGRYVTESEAVADAISELRFREEEDQTRLAELRAKIRVGIEELDRSDCAEWNVEEVKAEGRALLASRQAAK